MAAEYKPQQISVEAYFELEKNASGICYEYVDGYAYMMAGESFNHDAIKSNIQGILWNFFLRSDECNVYSSDMKTQISEKRYYHPDVVISCDPRDQGTGDLLKYPRVIFEVLSPGTAMRDRTRKMRDYLALPTLEEYVLVSSKSCRMEMYRKEADEWWYYILNSGDQFELRSLGLRFPLMDAYHFERKTPPCMSGDTSESLESELDDEDKFLS